MKVKDKKVAVETESIMVLDAGMAPTSPYICCTGALQIFR